MCRLHGLTISFGCTLCSAGFCSTSSSCAKECASDVKLICAAAADAFNTLRDECDPARDDGGADMAMTETRDWLAR